MMIEPDLIQRARSFSDAAHGGDLRKRCDVRAFDHAEAVARILEGAGFGREIVAAGYLHDVVEDTDRTLEEIGSLFGPRVAELVGCVTEASKAGWSDEKKKRTWKERKTRYIENLRKAPLDAVALSLADKIDNILSCIRHHAGGGSAWEISRGSRKDQVWYYETIRGIARERFGPSPGKKHALLQEKFESVLERLLELC